MTDDPKPHSWWQTLPGVLTAIAGIITALAGLVAALYQAGWFQESVVDRQSTAAPISTPAKTPAEHSLSPGQTPPSPTPVNLLATENGGHLVAASGDDWVGTIDGKENFNQISHGLTEQKDAVYAFRDEKPAVIERFTVLINQTGDNNIKEFELFAGNATPTGPFESVGIFTAQNVKLFKTPYQEFKLPQVTAKYLKIRLLSTYGFSHPRMDEVQAFGYIAE